MYHLKPRKPYAAKVCALLGELKMMDYLTLGPAPCEESCAQVGHDDYDRMSRLECRIYLDQLRRTFPEPERGYFKIKSFPHDFGSYREVCAVYDEDDQEATEWAFNVENNGPTEWDDEARAQLLEQLSPEKFYA